jgi:predicted ATP-binding protein involved in virulence
LDPGDDWIGAFAALSAGHKIVLNIVVQLCAFMQPRSLVLFDEPELHLHPPLVAALLRAVGVTLERYNSFAIVATHSPVVVQEVPSANVTVLTRYFDELQVEQPQSETFAENVGLLTRRIFSLDSSATDYEGILRRLVEKRTLDEIEALFPNGLSSQGRAIVLSLQRGSGGTAEG